MTPRSSSSESARSQLQLDEWYAQPLVCGTAVGYPPEICSALSFVRLWGLIDVGLARLSSARGRLGVSGVV